MGGDLYGSAHARPTGAIWMDLMLALFSLDAAVASGVLRPAPLGPVGSLLYGFIALWALATPVFFTFSGNILWTYLLPSLPAWSLLLAGALKAVPWQTGKTIIGLILALLLPVWLLIAAIDGRAFNQPNNQRELARA